MSHYIMTSIIIIMIIIGIISIVVKRVVLLYLEYRLHKLD